MVSVGKNHVYANNLDLQLVFILLNKNGLLEKIIQFSTEGKH
jgi:hypothetical protein